MKYNNASIMTDIAVLVENIKAGKTLRNQKAQVLEFLNNDYAIEAPILRAAGRGYLQMAAESRKKEDFCMFINQALGAMEAYIDKNKREMGSHCGGCRHYTKAYHTLRDCTVNKGICARCISMPNAGHFRETWNQYEEAQKAESEAAERAMIKFSTQLADEKATETYDSLLAFEGITLRKIVELGMATTDEDSLALIDDVDERVFWFTFKELELVMQVKSESISRFLENLTNKGLVKVEGKIWNLTKLGLAVAKKVMKDVNGKAPEKKYDVDSIIADILRMQKELNNLLTRVKGQESKIKMPDVPEPTKVAGVRFIGQAARGDAERAVAAAHKVIDCCSAAPKGAEHFFTLYAPCYATVDGHKCEAKYRWVTYKHDGRWMLAPQQSFKVGKGTVDDAIRYEFDEHSGLPGWNLKGLIVVSGSAPTVNRAYIDYETGWMAVGISDAVEEARKIADTLDPNWMEV